MDEPLDELYLKWLYRQVASVKLRNPARTYWSLIRHLYTREFLWSVPNDDNRVEDGRALRDEFSTELEITPDPEWMELNCSILEMLIGLARRLSFESEGEPDVWFWHMLENLSLRDYSDAVYNKRNDRARPSVDLVINRLIDRQYYPDGRGGLFPLAYPPEDQRDVEIWYQMSHYLLERT